MPIIIGVVLVLLIIYAPQWWVTYTLRKNHQTPENNFPGTGGEFAYHLLKTMKLDEYVSVESTDIGDHYDPETRTVRLTADKFNGKTLTSITVAAHEVGHALQHAANEPMFLWRGRLAKLAYWSQKIGAGIMVVSPLLGLVSRMPIVTMMSFIGAFLIMGVGVVVQLITLPVELDASYKKALPILKNGYLTEEQYKPAEQILKAAAMTYVAGALASLLNFWRWLQILKR